MSAELVLRLLEAIDLTTNNEPERFHNAIDFVPSRDVKERRLPLLHPYSYGPLLRIVEPGLEYLDNSRELEAFPVQPTPFSVQPTNVPDNAFTTSQTSAVPEEPSPEPIEPPSGPLNEPQEHRASDETSTRRPYVRKPRRGKGKESEEGKPVAGCKCVLM